MNWGNADSGGRFSADTAKGVIGFTLIELMVGLVVLAVILLVALPSFHNLLRLNRMAVELNSFSASYHLARSEAIKSGESVTMCVSTDGRNCTGGNWHQGWIVFFDPDEDEKVEKTGQIIRVQDAFDSDHTLTGNSHVKAAIGFSPSGLLIGVSNGTVTLNTTPPRKEYRRCVVISTVGRLDLRRGENCD